MKINAVLEGKTVENALTDGKDLILRMTTGEEVVIDFENGPHLKRVDVRIILTGVSMQGVAEL